MPYFFVDRRADDAGVHLVHDWNDCALDTPESERLDLGWQARLDDAVRAATGRLPQLAGCACCARREKTSDPDDPPRLAANGS